MTLHRTANIRVKHLNSDIKQTRRGIVLLLLLLLIEPILIVLYRFSVKKKRKQTGFLGQNSDILIPPQVAIYEISIVFVTEKSAKVVCYIVIALP